MSSELEAFLPPIIPVGRKTVLGLAPPPSYSKFSEKIRQSAPADFQCAVFCGGRKCKYETPSNWSKEDMAVDGIYSHWITSEVLAMARPNTETIKNYNVIDQFHNQGIKSVINLEEPGEHSSCGNPLEDTGFSYNPNIFMENEIFFYNFRWKDYGIVSQQTMLDMVKVLCFAVSEGKVAVHCHAGLGRTGVLIACYLIFTMRCKPPDAIRYVRLKRPQSIQTRNQIQCILQFAQFVIPLFTIYPHALPKPFQFTAHQYLNRQRHLLHGYEARHLKFIPKIVYIICERLLRLAGKHQPYTPSCNGNRQPMCLSEVISYQLTGSTSFCTFFLSAACPEDNNWRPASQLTIQLSSGIGSPDQLTNSSQMSGTPEVSANEQQHHSDHAPSPGSNKGVVVISNGHSEPSNTAGKVDGNKCQKKNNDGDTSTTSKGAAVTRQPAPGQAQDSARNVVLAAATSIKPTYPPAPPPPYTPPNDVHASESFLLENALESAVEAPDESTKEPYLDSESDDSYDSTLFADHPAPDFHHNECYQELDVHSLAGSSSGFGSGCGTADDEGIETVDPMEVVNALMADHYLMDPDFLDNLTEFQEPVMDKQDLIYIVLRAERPIDALAKLERDTRYTTEYLVRFIARLRINSEEVIENLLRRLMATLTHQCLKVHGVLKPQGVKWTKMREGTTKRVMLFVQSLYDLLSR